MGDEDVREDRVHDWMLSPLEFKRTISKNVGNIMKELRRVFSIVLLTMAVACVANAQSANFERQGNTFVSKSSRGSKAEPTKTKFTWKDSKGNEYPVYISSNGSCFVIKVSAKTGKEYRNYLGPEISQQICKELGIEYKNKKGNKV